MIRVARSRGSGVRIRDITVGLGISESRLSGWLKKADVADRVKPGVAEAEHAEHRGLQKRQRLLEQGNEVLRRAEAYLPQANLP